MQKLRDTESDDRLPVQVNAYLDNTIDVQSLLEDSDTKTAALERVAELEEALSFVSVVLLAGFFFWGITYYLEYKPQLFSICVAVMNNAVTVVKQNENAQFFLQKLRKPNSSHRAVFNWPTNCPFAVI